MDKIKQTVVYFRNTKKLNIKTFINIFLALIIDRKNHMITSMDVKIDGLLKKSSLLKYYSPTINYNFKCTIC